MFVSESNGERKRMRFRESLGFGAIGATPHDIFAMNLGFFEDLSDGVRDGNTGEIEAEKFVSRWISLDGVLSFHH
ncbi:hypothetical protein L2E82_08031 [Cichorium intybus]|uniref:Uncharacterized protein n=1 Tax=Cichorium intybus TaxID=13427 RepID=A0ACB9G544_CICIN|nr:hypothetical protein L2E82_08031 [Cichorium intybus]